MNVLHMMLYKPTGVVVPYNEAMMKTGNFELWPKPKETPGTEVKNPEPESNVSEPSNPAPKKGRPRKATAE